MEFSQVIPKPKRVERLQFENPWWNTGAILRQSLLFPVQQLLRSGCKVRRVAPADLQTLSSLL